MNVCLRQWKHLCSWERITQTIYIPSKIQVKISLQKKMFEISVQLIMEQSDEIFGISTINLEHSSWKYLSLVGDEQVISLLHKKVYVFSDSVLCLGKVNENPKSNIAWEDRLKWFKDSSQYRALKGIDGQPMEFGWNIFPGFTTLELVREVQKFMSKMGEPEQFQGRIIFMSMFNDIIWGKKDIETDCIANSSLVSLFAKRFPARRWSFLGLGSEKKWYSTYNERPGGKWDRVAELMMIKFGNADTQFSDPRVRCLEERSKAKEVEKLSIHFGAVGDTIENFFSHNHVCQSVKYLRSSLRFV